jgi:hypothetical protein
MPVKAAAIAMVLRIWFPLEPELVDKNDRKGRANGGFVPVPLVNDQSRQPGL